MKKIIIYIIFLIIAPYNAWSQCGEELNGVTTDPTNPINPDCPNMLNQFDWTEAIYNTQWYAGNGSSGNLSSPFFQTGNTANKELWDTDDYEGKDFLPEDGWELIMDGITKTQLANISLGESPIAYLVLYNKFTGILRVLGARNDIGQNDYMAIYLNFLPNANNRITGLLGQNRQLAQSLDRKSDPIIHSNAAITDNSSILFFYADFQMGYDPCTCLFDEGNIQVLFEAVDEQRLQIYGRSWAIDNDLANIAGGTSSLSQNYLSNVFSNPNTNLSEAGTLTFNNWDELLTLYEQQKTASSVLKEQYDDIENLKKKWEYAAEIAGLISFGKDDNKFDIKGIQKPMSLVAKYIERWGAPLKKKLDNANKQVDATGKIRLIQSEMTFQGKIIDKTPKGSFEFKVPGRLNNNLRCDDINGPMYDEVLGRFALLKTPKIQYSLHSYEERRDQRLNTHYYSPKYRFKLVDNSIDYLFNPAAKVNLENTKIYAGLVIKNKRVNPGSYPNQDFMGGYSIDYVASLSSVDTNVFVTKFVPLDCLSELGTELYIPFHHLTSLNSYPDLYDVQLRLIIFYEFDQLNSQNLKNQAVEVLTYPTDFSFTSNTISSPFGLSNGQVGFPEDEETINSTNYTGSRTIFAWDKIIIDGNLTTSSGVEVTIIAPKIEIVNGSSIGSGILLRNGEFPISCSTLSQFDVNQLANYCTAGSYEANKPSITKELQIENNDILYKKVYFKSSPNPFKETTQLNVNLPQSSEVSKYYIIQYIRSSR